MNKKIKVLMVDDEEQFRATTKKILNRRGFDTLVAGSGEEAIKALAFAGSKAAGAEDQKAIEVYDAAQKKLDDQQAAWPTLSAVSNLAGMAAYAMATGGAAAAAQGGVRAGSMLGLGALEGAAGCRLADGRLHGGQPVPGFELLPLIMQHKAF